MTIKPLLAVTMGDPGGIGPEIIAKSLAIGSVQATARPFIIGSATAMEWGVSVAKLRTIVKRVRIADLPSLPDEPGAIFILDGDELAPERLTPSQATAESGQAQFEWGRVAQQLLAEGVVPASAGAPINTSALKLAGHDIGSSAAQTGSTYLFLVSGSLKVVHLTDHVSMRETIDLVKRESVARAIKVAHESFVKWGVRRPRIGVCGLNAHSMGLEEEEEIRPAIDDAKAAGIDADGPVPPDSVFRQCVEGKYDVVLAMYHDQGHIAVKTWGFVGNIALVVGSPYISIGTAHGTAYDIAGRGVARHEMILTAMLTAASLAAGKGFPQFQEGPTPS